MTDISKGYHRHANGGGLVQDTASVDGSAYVGSDYMPRGYFAIGVYHAKSSVNIGTLWRSANLFGAAFLFTIGRQYQRQSSDTMKTPLHVPLFEFETFDDFFSNRTWNCPLIAVEQRPTARDLGGYGHPERAVYLLGAEDTGLPEHVLDRCVSVVQIPLPDCLNVAVAGSIVMYDRAVKANHKGGRT